MRKREIEFRAFVNFNSQQRPRKSEEIMKSYLLPLVLTVGCTAFDANAQTQPKTNAETAKTATEKPKDAKSSGKPQITIPIVALKADATPLELAKAALAAHGGDNFKNAKSLTQIGTVDVSLPNSAQSMTASYKIQQSGDKFRLEINAPVVNLLQIYDGQQLYTSVGGSDIPPVTQLGMLLLTKIENDGYKVSALPDQKKRRSFRIATPEGYSTDFHLDSATGRVQSYESKYTVRDKEVTTSVENDKFREVEGILLPEKFSQRFDMAFGTVYAAFKAKGFFANTAIPDDVFKIPEQ